VATSSIRVLTGTHRIVWASGLQQIGRRARILHTGIKPHVIAIWIENHWHPVVDSGGHGIWRRGQDRAGSTVVPLDGLLESDLARRTR